MTRQGFLLPSLRVAMPSIARLRESAPRPSPGAGALLARETAPRLLRSRRLAPQTAASPVCAAAVRQAPLPAFVAPQAARRSQRSPIPRVMRLAHPRGHWPSSWPIQAVPLAATLLPLLLYLFDTI